MAHYAKYTKGAAGSLTRHYERAKNSKGEYIKKNFLERLAEKPLINGLFCGRLSQPKGRGKKENLRNFRK